MTDRSGRPALPSPRPRPAGAPTALGGIRVLDFTRLIAGPYCTMLLSDLGAEVLKVEHPVTGDDSRQLRPPEVGGLSSMFVMMNRGKRSIALDLASPEGKALARELARKADVVVENFSAGVMDRLGLGYETLRADNPGLVYCAIGAFGREGAYADRPGYDPIAQSESGFLSLNGFPDGDPVRAGPPIVDISTGMMACNAVLGALVARGRTGEGQYVEAALFDDAVNLTGQYGMNFLMTGQDQPRWGNGAGAVVPVGLFHAADGPIYVTCANDRNYRRLATDVLGRPDLADSPDYATNELRVRNRKALDATLTAIFETQPREHWREKGRAAGVPIGNVRTVAEAFTSPEIADRGLLSTLPHPTAGTLPNIAPPFRLAGTPLADPVAAPALGAHTAEILREVLGCDAARYSELAATGIFGAAPPAY